MKFFSSLPFLSLLRIVTAGVLLLLTTGCFLNSKITDFEQKSLTVEKKIILTAKISALSLIEGSSFTLDLNLDTEHTTDTLVQLSVTGATSGLTRFSSAPATALFPAGTMTKSITFTTIDDLTVQGNETFSVNISCALTNMELETNSVSFTVLDNDVAPLPAVTVAKTFPTNGAKWLSYIKSSSGVTRFFNQPDVACAGNETGSTEACIHGGDKLKVIATGYTTCTGLSITDYLGAFDWLCSVTAGVATFYSTGLKSGKGISDLIDFTSNVWTNNYVTVKLNNTAVMASVSAKWWNTTTENPIAPAPDSTTATQTLTGYQAGTILTIPNSITSYGFNINQDSLAIVVNNGSKVTYGGNTANCDEFTGETTTPNYKILVCTGSQKYLWVEGAFTGSGANVDHIVVYTLTSFSRLNKIRIDEGGEDVSILLYDSNYNNISDVETKGGAGFGVMWMHNASYNRVTKFKSSFMRALSWYPAINIESDCNFNVLQDIHINNWGGDAVQMHGNNNILGQVLVTNAGSIEILGQNQVLTYLTSSNNAGAGLDIGSSNNALVNQFFSNASVNEIFVASSTNVTFSQIAVRRSYDYSIGFDFDGSNGTKFTNNILIDDNSNTPRRCQIANGGANPGVIANTCGNMNTSDANWVYYPFAALSPILGTIATDSINSHGSTNSIAWTSVSDWLNFENNFRSWSSQTLGQCNSGNCVLMDFRIRTADTLIKNKSGDGLTANAAFTAGTACPTAIHGNKAISDSQPTPHTFLINAFEIYGDGVGNDNTLCESNEDCLYSPNFGAYQGEGDYKSNGTCTFQDGTVSGVTMYAYPINGG